MQIVHFSDCLVQNVKQGLQCASFLMPANLFLSPTFAFCTNQNPLKTIVWNEISFKMQPLILRKYAWIFPTEPLADFCSSSRRRVSQWVQLNTVFARITIPLSLQQSQSVRHLRRRALLHFPSLGIHYVTLIDHRLSVLRITWPALLPSTRISATLCLLSNPHHCLSVS